MSGDASVFGSGVDCGEGPAPTLALFPSSATHVHAAARLVISSRRRCRARDAVISTSFVIGVGASIVYLAQ
jgi:hypothetical protein